MSLHQWPVAMVHSSSDGSSIHYVLLVLLDDVMFLHNRVNDENKRQCVCFIHQVFQVAAPGAKSAVSDCVWFNGYVLGVVNMIN